MTRRYDVSGFPVKARFAEGYGLANALVHNDIFYAFASRFEAGNWNDVTMFKSSDLKAWEQKRIIEQEKEKPSKDDTSDIKYPF